MQTGLETGQLLGDAPSVAADTEGMRGLLYDLCCILQQSGTEERIQPLSRLEAILSQSASLEYRNLVSSQLADIFWLLDLGCDDSTERRAGLAELVKTVAERKLVDEDILRERLEPELLELAELLPSAQAFHKKLIRVNTSMLYKQQKFNLLREESEGFAKLITSLINAQDVTFLYSQVVSLIDPNRVLDVIFDVYSQRIEGAGGIFEDLLHKLAYPPNIVANVIGFKLGYLMKERRSEEVLPKMLLAVARMIHLGMMTLEGIHPHLLPTDEETDRELGEIKKRIRNGTPAIVIKETTPKDLVQEHQPTVKSIPTEIELAVGPIKNEKVFLTAGLLQVGEFEKARYFLDRFPAIVHIPMIARRIALAVHVIIEPFSPHHSTSAEYLGLFSTSPEKLSSIVPTDLGQLLPRLITWLRYLQNGMYLDAVLISKVCRVGCAYLEHDSSDQAKGQWLTILMEHLLPASTLVQSCPAVAFEIWQLLKQFPYAIRYGVYGQWRNEIYGKTCELSLAKNVILSDIRRVMRRLTKENVRQYGRLIAKLAHSNPVIVFPVILEQLQAYDNLIQPVVDSLKYLTPLGFDVLSFVLIDCLAASPGKERLKQDGTNLSSWLQGLATFTGSLYRRYHGTVDAESIIQYIVNQLKHENSFDLIVLSELIHRMGGIESVENMSDSHIEALAGGPLLLGEVLSQQTISTTLRFNKRANHKLISVLLESKLAIPLWILLAQQRTSVTFRIEFPHLKLIGGLVDMGNAVFLQYSALITQAISESLIDPAVLCLPDLEVLLKDYHIDLDFACSIRRSLMRASRQLDPFQDQSLQLGPLGVNTLSVDLCRIFWFLELSDIHCPIVRYQSEGMRLKTILSSSHPPNSTNEAELSRWRKDRERAPQAILALEAEQQSQQQSISKCIDSLEATKDSLFPQAGYEAMSDFFLHCALPRAIFSPSDAMFTARFVILLCRVNAKNFSIVWFFERLASDLRGVLTMLTEREAHNFARFMAILMGELTNWLNEEASFKSQIVTIDANLLKSLQPTDKVELNGLTADSNGLTANSSDLTANSNDLMVDSMGESNQNGKVELGDLTADSMGESNQNGKVELGDLTADSMGESNDSTYIKLEYGDFRHLIFRWHRLIQDAVEASIATREYLSIRNSVIILTGISSYIPMIKSQGRQLLKKMTILRDEEEREDLKVLVTRYTAMLAMSEAGWRTDEQTCNTPKSESGEIFDQVQSEMGEEARSSSRKRKRNETEEEQTPKRSKLASPKGEERRREDQRSRRDSDRTVVMATRRTRERDHDRDRERDKPRERDPRDREQRDRERERDRDRDRDREREQREPSHEVREQRDQRELRRDDRRRRW